MGISSGKEKSELHETVYKPPDHYGGFEHPLLEVQLSPHVTNKGKYIRLLVLDKYGNILHHTTSVRKFGGILYPTSDVYPALIIHEVTGYVYPALCIRGVTIKQDRLVFLRYEDSCGRRYAVTKLVWNGTKFEEIDETKLSESIELRPRILHSKITQESFNDLKTFWCVDYIKSKDRFRIFFLDPRVSVVRQESTQLVEPHLDPYLPMPLIQLVLDFILLS